MAASSAGTGLSFLLTLPPDWLVLDLESERIPVQVERLIEAAAGRDAGVAAHRGQIERQIRSVLREARTRDLSFCAMLATVIDDVLPMTATLTVSLRAAPDGADVNAIIGDLRRRPNAVVGEFLVPAVGPSVRAVYREVVEDLAASGPVEAAVCQYFVPAPRGSKVAVITAATPTLPLADHFAALFDEVAATFEFAA